MDLRNKLSPMAFGAEFRLQPTHDTIEIDVTLNWTNYYRVFPTLIQQREHQLRNPAGLNPQIIDENADRKEENNEIEDPCAILDPTNDAKSSKKRNSRDTLFIKFKKIPCKARGVIYLNKIDNSWSEGLSSIIDPIDKELIRAINIVLSDPSHITTTGPIDEKIRVPEKALSSEENYNKFINSLFADAIPDWKWNVRLDLSKEGIEPNLNNIIVTVEFINSSKMIEQSPNVELFFFDTKSTFIFKGCRVLPFQTELAPKGFRYNRDLCGRGFNCAVVHLKGNLNHPDTFETTNVPIYPQKRQGTNNEPEAPFDKLAEDPLPILDNILESMRLYLNDWDVERTKYINSDKDWENKYAFRFDSDRKVFESEISRFEHGLRILEDPDILLAFKLTNETFLRSGKISSSKKSHWRLFQIVFLVSQIPDICAVTNPQKFNADIRKFVDIIYFPTGGGKTEAYLAAIVFHCFFDRLRGKSAGATAWIRFPLRLLTLQQMQRVADIIGMAELVRREQKDPRINGNNVDGFGVGYFVGKEATPNKIEPPTGSQKYNKMTDPNWSKAMDENARQEWKKIIRCPNCGSKSVRLDFDAESVRLIHRCTNKDCAFADGVIPVYVVDKEIYRYLPCVLVGTIDKLANLGNQRMMSLLFGNVEGRCEIHGYCNNGKCLQEGCTSDRIKGIIPNSIGGLTLFVQDELHLLKEGLGTFDSHYESFVQKVLQEFGEKAPLKIIASSATVEAFERQVEHLYGREANYARIFPGLGPTLEKSFYIKTFDHVQRFFVGILPHNKEIFNSMLDIIQYYHEELQDLKDAKKFKENPFRGKIVSQSKEWNDLIDIYSTSLIYFQAGRLLDGIGRAIKDTVNADLDEKGYRILNIDELTGNTTTDRITKILEKLETPMAITDSSLDSVLATNMISHGVDIDRLNAMIFYGMPKQNAEYIQASSRAGRAHVGIIFVCLNPVRERDQSHYSYFTKFHEFLGQLIEPVAINRWSKFSIQRTLPGLFMAVLLQLVANKQNSSNPGKYYRLDFVKKEISEGRIRAEDFIPILEDAYLVNTKLGINQAQFKEEIRLRVRQFFDQIVGAGSQGGWISEALKPTPMSSLRDIDEQIEIELDSNGREWARKASK